MASLAELYGRLKKNWPEQDFGPGDSMIASAIRNPAEAARRMYGSAVEGLPTMYDEPQTQLYKSLSSLAGMINPVGRQMPGTLAAINASHGSPHAFTKFRLANIGTGEGAQAYGHGLYFGEGFDSPVAKEYQRALAGKDKGIYGQIASNALKGRTPKEAIEYLTPSRNMTPEAAKAQLEAIDLIKSGQANEGHMYNVSLRWPDAAREAADPLGPQHFLDWDAPLSEQPELVRNALSDFVKERKSVMEARKHIYTSPVETIINRQKGEDWYSDLSGAKNGDIAASNYLKSLGIPGIRYLDAGSRGAGVGTSNYVVFDEDIPEIVTRNNRSLADLLRR